MIFDRLSPQAAAGGAITTSHELYDALLRGHSTAAGVDVNEASAMRASAVYACVSHRADAIAALPIGIFRRDDTNPKKRDAQRDHPLWRLIVHKPNDLQTTQEWLETVSVHLDLRGNHYSFKLYLRGELRELIPIHPDRVKVLVTPSRKLVYEVSPEAGRAGPILQFTSKEILHLRNLSTDGLVGRNRIEDFKNAVGLALAQEQHGAEIFASGAKLGIVLRHPGEMSAPAYERLKESLDKRAGTAAFKPFIAEEGMDVTTVTMTAADAQFLEARRFQVEDIARLFRVPPHLIGETTKQTSYGKGVEEMSIGYVRWTVRPHARRIAKRLTLDLGMDPEKEFIEFNLNGLMEGDFKSRQEGQAIQRQNGVINANEWRSNEGMNPRDDDDGEAYLTPMNMGRDGQQETTNQDSPTDQEESEDE